MIQIASVDDELSAANAVLEMAQRFSAETGELFDMKAYTSGHEFLKNRQFPEIVFLDIEMPILDGMETARAIRCRDSGCVIIFVTNMAQYAIEGYSVNALDYVLKPLRYESFRFKMKRALEEAKKLAQDEITLNIQYGKRKLLTSDIRYIEVIKHKLILHTHQETLEIWDSMKNMNERLKDHGFALCSASYLVNLKYVRSVVNNEVSLGEITLPISRQKKNGFLDALAAYMR